MKHYKLPQFNLNFYTPDIESTFVNILEITSKMGQHVHVHVHNNINIHEFAGISEVRKGFFDCDVTQKK